MIRRPPRSTQSRSSAASDVYKRQYDERVDFKSLLLADADVISVLDRSAIEKAFDLEDQFRNVDAIFERVFAAVPAAV